MTTVLITGATGFIGKNLVLRLKKEGYNSIKCLVRKSASEKNIKFLNEQNVEIVYGDILNKKEIESAVKNVDIVFHLANIGNVTTQTNKVYKQYQEVNVYGTETLLQCLINNHIQRLIYLSSAAVFGTIKRKVINETFAPSPSTPYSRTKYDAEQIVLKYYRKYKLPVCILRPTMTYGPHGVNSEILTIAKLIKYHILPLIGGGEYNINLIYVDDLIDSMLKASVIPTAVGNIYIISSDEDHTLKDLAKIIAQYLNIKIYGIYLPVGLSKLLIFFIERFYSLLKKDAPFTLSRLNHLLQSTTFDVDKAKKELNFTPSVTLEVGLKKTIEWYKKEGLL